MHNFFLLEESTLYNGFYGMKFDFIIIDEINQEADKDKKEAAQKNYLDLMPKWNKGGRK